MTLKILVDKYGSNEDVDASTGGAEDIIAEGGLQYWPATEDYIDVSSSSINDTDGGTGANSVVIQGVNEALEPIAERVDLNGTTVATTVNKFYRINRAEVTLSGALAGNEGVITFSDGTGTLAIIPATKSGTLKASYTVPAGYDNAYIRHVHVRLRSRTVNYADVELLVRQYGSNTWRTRKELEVSASTPYEDVTAYLPVKSGDDIVMRVLSASADNLPFSAEFQVAYESTNP